MADEKHVPFKAVRDEPYAIETGVRHQFVIPRERRGQLYFVLLSEVGVERLKRQDFQLRGHQVELAEETDDQGEFKHGPVEFGEYELQVEDGVYRIPAVPQDALPHPVHVRHFLVADDWDGPTDAEIEGHDGEPDPTDDDFEEAGEPDIDEEAPQEP